MQFCRVYFREKVEKFAFREFRNGADGVCDFDGLVAKEPVNPKDAFDHGLREAFVHEVVDRQYAEGFPSVPDGESLFWPPENIDIVFADKTRQRALLPQNARKAYFAFADLDSEVFCRGDKWCFCRGEQHVFVLVVDFLQGFYFSKPVPKDEFVALGRAHCQSGGEPVSWEASP